MFLLLVLSEDLFHLHSQSFNSFELQDESDDHFGERFMLS